MILFYTCRTESVNPQQTEAPVGAGRSPEKCAQQRPKRAAPASQRSSSLPPSSRKSHAPSKLGSGPRQAPGPAQPHAQARPPALPAPAPSHAPWGALWTQGPAPSAAGRHHCCFRRGARRRAPPREAGPGADTPRRQQRSEGTSVRAGFGGRRDTRLFGRPPDAAQQSSPFSSVANRCGFRV